jgi:hypothetical protein
VNERLELENDTLLDHRSWCRCGLSELYFLCLNACLCGKEKIVKQKIERVSTTGRDENDVILKNGPFLNPPRYVNG